MNVQIEGRWKISYNNVDVLRPKKKASSLNVILNIAGDIAKYSELGKGQLKAGPVQVYGDDETEADLAYPKPCYLCSAYRIGK